MNFLKKISKLQLHVADIVQEGKDITLIAWGAQLRVIKEVFS